MPVLDNLRRLGWVIGFFLILALLLISGMAGCVAHLCRRLEHWADRRLWSLSHY